MRIALTSLLFLLPFALGDSAGGLYPPGLLPLINRANIMLSTGQFNEAAKLYSEAIDQSPKDYLLYYKRATALLSMQIHTAALEDYDKVLSLTSQTFDSAHLAKARNFLKEGDFSASRASLAKYTKAKGRDSEAAEVEKDIEAGERERKKTMKESGVHVGRVRLVPLELRVFPLRLERGESSVQLRVGILKVLLGDLICLTHLLPPSTTLLAHLFSLSYILLPSSPSSLSSLKQCLHYDPDS